MGFLIVSIVLLIFSGLNWFHGSTLFLWKCSVVSKEYGHWFALVCFILIWVFLRKKTRIRVIASAILAVAFVGYIEPLTSLLYHESEWQKAIGEGESIPSF